MRVLVTGGAGYIGSHTALQLLHEGHEVIVYDDFSNSSTIALDRVGGLCASGALHLVTGDVRDPVRLAATFETWRPEAVVHFAGRKAVGESVSEPLGYYDTNVAGTLQVLKAMAASDCRRFVFSSSATVYGNGTPPYAEDAPLAAMSPYGRTKLQVENLLADVAHTGGWRIAVLRYFNPIGAHPSGLIGEDPRGIPNNLLPYLAQVATGRRDHITVFGEDYDTPDGTGVRDYIHVVDLAEGHLRALQVMDDRTGFHAWNLGTGQGHTVLEVIGAFEAAVGHRLATRIGPRRDGDVAVLVADPSRAARELGWRATRDLAAMCRDHWAWQSSNPRGYQTAPVPIAPAVPA